MENFGNWTFDKENLTLTYAGDGGYEVDLERCTTSAEVLDWVCQVASQQWASTEDIGNLVRAISAILEPQATLCGEGQERGPIEVRQVVEQNVELRKLFK